jgi:UDP-N-acetylmuramate--alanine ligase
METMERTALSSDSVRSTSRNLCAGVPRRVHLLGAGGAGVSGAARILHAHGHELSGHDRAESDHVELLRSLGVAVQISPQESARLPDGVEMLVRSAAVPSDDAQVADAIARGVPVLKYSELVGRIAPRDRTLAVAGTHGKTTTAWMLHHALRGLADARPGSPMPGALIGGICRTIGANAVAHEDGGWFAVEACEYDRSFHQLAPRGAIATNVEADHLDYYGSLDAIHTAFAHFADRLPSDGLFVIGAAVHGAVERAARCPVWRFGRELRAELVSERAGRFTFRLVGPGFRLPHVALAVPGGFNVENASLALGLVAGLAGPAGDFDPAEAAELAARGLERYTGSKRRFEPWGQVGGIELVHDYAHHPTEVRVTLEAARRALPGKPLHVLFQPHQHSRTARFFDGFVESLRFADRVVVADVYGARKHIDGSHTAGAREMADALRARGVDAVAPGALDPSADEFASALPDPAAGLVLGAGDIEGIKDGLLARLALRGTPRRRAR